MASLNKVMLIGNLGKDPETLVAGGGLPITKFSLATTETRTDKATGQKTETTEWSRITTFGVLAENCARYLAKGKSAYVEGRLQTSSYEKDGITRYSTDIIANVVLFLSPSGGQGQDNQGGYPNQSPGGHQNQPSQPPQGQPYGSYSNQPPSPPQGQPYNQNQNQNQGGYPQY